MNERHEAEELVLLWQELQEAQVAGDAERLAVLRRRAESESQRPDASREWQLLEQEAGRYRDRRQRVPDVQRPGRARREADANAHASIVT